MLPRVGACKGVRILLVSAVLMPSPCWHTFVSKHAAHVAVMCMLLGQYAPAICGVVTLAASRHPSCTWAPSTAM